MYEFLWNLDNEGVCVDKRRVHNIIRYIILCWIEHIDMTNRDMKSRTKQNSLCMSCISLFLIYKYKPCNMKTSANDFYMSLTELVHYTVGLTVQTLQGSNRTRRIGGDATQVRSKAMKSLFRGMTKHFVLNLHKLIGSLWSKCVVYMHYLKLCLNCPVKKRTHELDNPSRCYVNKIARLLPALLASQLHLSQFMYYLFLIVRKIHEKKKIHS